MTPDERLAVTRFECTFCGATEGENCLVVSIDEDKPSGLRIVTHIIAYPNYAERPHPERVALVALLSAVDRLAERGRG